MNQDFKDEPNAFDQCPEACEMCGVGFVGIDAWHATVPVERWLCEPCDIREGGAMKNGTYRSEYYPAP